MAEHVLSDIMAVTMDKIKGMLDVNTVVGTPIETQDGITLIPISKISFGFGSGGSDFAGKAGSDKIMFGGGNGAGASIDPIAFLVVNHGNVKVLSVAPPPNTTVDRIVDLAPEVIDKISALFKKEKTDKTEE
ncbi:MAG: GerW family sporulation protein [Clostridia bacterium]